jgi:hypothetical protein
MNSDQFIHWLWGYFEIADPKEMGEKEVELLKKRLTAVYEKEIEPKYSTKGSSKKSKMMAPERLFSDMLTNRRD